MTSIFIASSILELYREQSTMSRQSLVTETEDVAPNIFRLNMQGQVRPDSPTNEQVIDPINPNMRKTLWYAIRNAAHHDQKHTTNLFCPKA